MLHQLEDISMLAATDVARQTYETLCAPPVECWDEKEEISICDRKFVLPEQKDEFLRCIRSKVWCTYRKGFKSMGSTGATSDSGWGCMLRSGQMMLAEALIRLNLGKDWNYDEQDVENQHAYWKILEQLVDRRSSRYSIHQIASMGVDEGKRVGAWFGPTTISHVLRKLSKFDEYNNIIIHVNTTQNTIYTEDIEKLIAKSLDKDYKEKDSENVSKTEEDAEDSTKINWKPLLLLIPGRIGLDCFNHDYEKHLKLCLHYPDSIGFVGGKPNRAFYFIGSSDSSLIFLDPHTTQMIPDLPVATAPFHHFDDSSYHCNTPRRIRFSEIDPSMSLGFFFKTREAFDQFVEKFTSYESQPDVTPIFFIIRSHPPVLNISCTSISQKIRGIRSEDSDQSDVDSDESYELLSEIV